MADFFKIGQAAYGGSNPSKAIGAGLQAAQKIFINFLGQEKARKEKADQITKGYLSQIPSIESIEKIPDFLKPKVNEYIANEKAKYVEFSRQLSTMSSSDPNYMTALEGLQKVKNNYKVLNESLLKFQGEKIEFTKSLDDDKISKGFKEGQLSKYNNTASMYAGKLPATIKDGQLIFKTQEGSYNFSNNEIGEWDEKNYDTQNALEAIELNIKKNAIQGIPFEKMKTTFQGQIAKTLKTKGDVLSLYYDTDYDFITGGKSLQTPEITKAIAEDNIDEAKELIKNELMKAVQNVYSTAYTPEKDRLNRLSEGDKKIARNFNNVKYNLEQIIGGNIKEFTIPGSSDSIQKNEDGSYNYIKNTTTGPILAGKNLSVKDIIFKMPDISHEKLVNELGLSLENNQKPNKEKDSTTQEQSGTFLDFLNSLNPND